MRTDHGMTTAPPAADPCDALVTACRDLLAADDARAQAALDRDRAIHALSCRDGAIKTHLAAQVLDVLRDAGFTTEQIGRLGVSRSNVLTAVYRPR